MKKILATFLVSLFMLSTFLVVPVASAKPENVPPKGIPDSKPPFDVPVGPPDNIPPITPGSIGREVIVHYAKPPWAGEPGGPDGEEEPKVYDYYELIGPKWDLSKYPDGVSYIVNPSFAPEGSDTEIVLAFETWDDVTTTELYNDAYTIDYEAKYNLDAPDDQNVLCWWKIAPPRVIAMAIIWYVDVDGSGEPSEGDETIDVDIIFNSFQKWSVEQNSKAFHIGNIATHEIGHSVGLDDLYDEAYSEISMYGYSKKGEIKKVSLDEGDIFGCQALYG